MSGLGNGKVRRPADRRLVALVAAMVVVAAAACAGSTGTAVPKREVAAQIDAELDDYFTIADTYGQVRAVLVYHQGEPVLERYTDAEAEDYWATQSVTKSVMSLLIGVALDQGYLDSVDQTLAELLPDYAADMSPQVGAITLREVLTHTAGFPDEWNGSYAFTDSEDWVRTTVIDRADVGPHDGSFGYSNAGTHLLSAILVEATGRSVLEFARANIFEPLGIESRPAWQSPSGGWEATPEEEALTEYYEAGFAWPVDPQGLHLGFVYLKLRPADLARIGQLYLDEGRWDGTQLVPASWVRESTEAQVEATGAGEAYGFMWWVTEVDGDPAYVAWGYGGQMIEVVPDRELVVVLATALDERDATAPNKAVGPVSATDMVSMVIAPHFAE